jgi:glycosyltransferase involved in cell wall biosynthesis
MTAISVIMPCYNRAYDLKRVLEAYDHQTTREEFELIAVDDCSKDETYQVLTSYQPQHYLLRVERQEKNAGQGAARNRAIPLVNSPLVAFVGDDILPDANFVQGHLDAHRCYPAEPVAILGRIQWPNDIPINLLMAHIDGVGAEQFSFHYFVDGQEYDYRHLYTSNISLKTSFLRSVNTWFDTDFVLYGFEDVELGYRLSKLGLKIIYQAAIGASHYHYHNVWTFLERQYKCGLMAVVLVRKHPELNSLMRTPVLQLLRLGFRPGVFFKKNTEEDRLWAEALAYRLSSYYEWKAPAWLDHWYVFILRYAYFTGILQGVFSSPGLSAWIRNLYCANYLLPQLRAYITQAWQEQAALPEFMTLSDIKRLDSYFK